MTSLHLFALTASRRPNYFFNPAFANTRPWSRAPTRSMSGSRITVASIFFFSLLVHRLRHVDFAGLDSLDRVSDDRLDHECVSTLVKG